jgi:CspA family cold shock protein
MAAGVVRSFDDEAGYGFIETDEGEQIFVHHTSILMDGFRTLAPGARVSFDYVIGKRGPEAKQVRVI